MSKNSIWHYAENGKVNGPISFVEIEALITEGKIKSDTSVWSGEGDWKSAKSTVLGGLFIPIAQSSTNSQLPPLAPPPLQSITTDNKFAWLLVTVPILGLFAYLLTGMSSIWVFIVILFVLNTIFLMQDHKTLQSNNHEVPKKGWNNLVPVYLWNRAKYLSQKSFYFWAWIVSFSFSILMVFAPQDTNADMSSYQSDTAMQQQLNEMMQAPVQTAQESNAE